MCVFLLLVAGAQAHRSIEDPVLISVQGDQQAAVSTVEACYKVAKPCLEREAR